MIPLPCNLITLWELILLDAELYNEDIRHQAIMTHKVVYETLPEMIC